MILEWERRVEKRIPHFSFLFWIVNKTFIEKFEHHVQDNEHSEQETNTSSRTKANRL